MKKKQIKAVRKTLMVAVEKVLTDNNESLISKIEKDLKRSMKNISVKSISKGSTKKKQVLVK